MFDKPMMDAVRRTRDELERCHQERPLDMERAIRALVRSQIVGMRLVEAQQRFYEAQEARRRERGDDPEPWSSG